MNSHYNMYMEKHSQGIVNTVNAVYSGDLSWRSRLYIFHNGLGYNIFLDNLIFPATNEITLVGYVFSNLLLTSECCLYSRIELLKASLT